MRAGGTYGTRPPRTGDLVKVVNAQSGGPGVRNAVPVVLPAAVPLEGDVEHALSARSV
jgi:hypothetical protein